MLQLTEEQILNNYGTLSSKLKEALGTALYFERIENIGKHFSLSGDDVNVLATAVGYVIIGFLPPSNLFKEVNDYLDADEKVVVEVIREINRKILFPLHEELEKLYKLPSHVEETLKIEEIKKSAPPEKKEQKVISLETLGATETLQQVQGKPPEQKVEIKTPVPKLPTEGKPFILHEEKPITGERKSITRPFSLPFKIFSTKPKPEPPPAVKARVEEPERVVHYSELRTPLEPFGEKEEIISLETLRPVEKTEAKTEAESEVKSEENPPVGGQPKLDGNIVNLKP